MLMNSSAADREFTLGMYFKLFSSFFSFELIVLQPLTQIKIQATVQELSCGYALITI